MISLTRKTLTRNGVESEIIRFEVWFQTPFGLIENLEDAVVRLTAADMDPETIIVPVSVAISESSYEVVGR